MVDPTRPKIGDPPDEANAAAHEATSALRGAGVAGLRRMFGSFASRPESGAIVGTIFLFVLFSLWADQFLTLPSIASSLTIAAELGIVAMGVALLMIAGEFDLSVGSVLGISSVMIPWLTMRNLPVGAAILIALLIALSIGLLNGLLVTWTRIPSFIVTLGGLLWWRGVLFAVTQGFPLRVDRGEPLLQLFSGRLAFGFNASLFWFLGLALVLSVVLVRTRFGNWAFACGGNVRAAEQLGIPVRRVKLVLFGLTAVLAGLAGVIQVGRFSAVDSLRGQGLELEAIAAAVIGGTRLTGGYGSVVGTALGCLMVGMIRTGLALAGVPGYWYRAFIGLLIVLVVIVNHRTGRMAPQR